MRKVTKEDVMYRQGKSKKQMVDSETFAIIAVIGLILTIVAIATLNIVN